MTQITVQIPGIEKLAAAYKRAPEKTKAEIKEAIAKSAIAIERLAKAEAPRKTSNLASKINATILPFGASIGPRGVPYAIFVEMGTRAHMIYPKKAGGVLHWPGHFAKFVNHPGTKPNPFMQRAAKAAGIPIKMFFGEAMKNIAKSLAK